MFKLIATILEIKNSFQYWQHSDFLTELVITELIQSIQDAIEDEKLDNPYPVIRQALQSLPVGIPSKVWIVIREEYAGLI